MAMFPFPDFQTCFQGGHVIYESRRNLLLISRKAGWQFSNEIYRIRMYRKSQEKRTISRFEYYEIRKPRELNIFPFILQEIPI